MTLFQCGTCKHFQKYDPSGTGFCKICKGQCDETTICRCTSGEEKGLKLYEKVACFNMNKIIGSEMSNQAESTVKNYIEQKQKIRDILYVIEYDDPANATRHEHIEIAINKIIELIKGGQLSK